MDIRSLIRPIIAGLVGIGLIILVIVVFTKIFSGHKSAPIQQTQLISYANTNAEASLLIDGPINLDQDHRQIKITVSKNQTEIDIMQGYQGSVTALQTYPNNTTAYADFLQALNHLNFTKGNADPSAQDERGYCPTTDRYVYTFTNGDKNLIHFWSAQCTKGTFGGQALNVRMLFERQIPEKDFDQLTANIPL